MRQEVDLRIVDAKDDDSNPVAWIVYGICKKCNAVIINDLFIQPEEPIFGVDYVIDVQKKSEKGTEWKGETGTVSKTRDLK